MPEPANVVKVSDSSKTASPQLNGMPGPFQILGTASSSNASNSIPNKTGARQNTPLPRPHCDIKVSPGLRKQSQTLRAAHCAQQSLYILVCLRNSQAMN